MKKQIRTLSVVCSLLFLLGIELLCNEVYIIAKEFSCSETQIPLSEYNIKMSSDESGKVYNYQINDKTDSHGKDYWEIKKYSYFDNQAVEDIYSYDKWVKYVKKDEKSNKTIVVSEAKGKGKLRFTTYKKNGKKISAFIDAFSKKNNYIYNMSIQDVVIKGNKMFYAYIKDSKFAHIRCINNKTGKLISDKVLKTKAKEFIEEIKIYSNEIYVQTENTVCVYSFGGKKRATYTLPAGDIHYTKIGEYNYYSNFDDISISGKYIFFINSNGVYRCNTQKKQGFKLYYDASDDANFKQCKVYDICATGKNEFVVMFVEKENIDMQMPSKIVRYMGNFN